MKDNFCPEEKLNYCKFFIGSTQVQSHQSISTTNQKQSNDQWVVVPSTARPSPWEDTSLSSRSDGRWAVVPTQTSSKGNLRFLLKF